MKAETMNFIIHIVASIGNGLFWATFVPSATLGVPLVLGSAVLISVSYIKIAKKIEQREEDNGN